MTEDLIFTLTANLRQTCLDTTAAQQALGELDQEMARLQQAREAKSVGLARLIGSREALAALFLPEGKTLQEAWDGDLFGLRTGKVYKEATAEGETA